MSVTEAPRRDGAPVLEALTSTFEVTPDLAEIASIIPSIRLLAFDFDGVFTDNKVYVNQDGQEMVCCTRADGIGLQKLRQWKIETVVISTEINPVVSARCRKLALRCVQNVADKRLAIDVLLREFGIGAEQAAFVGNDINDVPCLDYVGLPIVVQDAHPDVLSLAKYRTRVPGGQGAVREVCDLFDLVLASEQRRYLEAASE